MRSDGVAAKVVSDSTKEEEEEEMSGAAAQGEEAKIAFAQPLLIDGKESTKERVARLLANNPLIDGHNDFPLSIRDHASNQMESVPFDSDLTKLEPWASDTMSRTDLPRLRAGQVGAQFWSAYMGCESQDKDAVQLFLEQVDVVKQLVSYYPNDLAWATTADQIDEAFASGRIASLVGVESGHAIGNSLAILRTLYKMGARYMTLTHSCNTPWAEAAQMEDGGQGLSDFGEKVGHDYLH